MLTGQELQRLIDGIESGDERIIIEAQAVSARESHAANNQLRRLESAGLDETSPAAQKVRFFLDEDMGGRNYFSESKKLEGDDLIRNLELTQEFRGDRTSTVTGERERRAGFDKQMDEISPAGDLTGRQRGYLRGFLGSDFWKDFKSTIYRTTKKSSRTPDESAEARSAIAEAAAAIQRGATIAELENLYENFKTQAEGDIFGVMREWKSAALNV